MGIFRSTLRVSPASNHGFFFVMRAYALYRRECACSARCIISSFAQFGVWVYYFQIVYCLPPASREGEVKSEKAVSIVRIVWLLASSSRSRR